MSKSPTRDQVDAAMRFYAEGCPTPTEAKPLERAAKNLSGINKDMEQVRRSDAAPAEKRQRLDALTVERNDLLKRTVQDAEQAQKEKGK